MKNIEARELIPGTKLYCKFHTPSSLVVSFVRCIDNRRILITVDGKYRVRAINTLKTKQIE
jgi:hypothetical protein